MDDQIEWTEFIKDAPNVTIVLQNEEIDINIFFNMNCCQKMFEHFDTGDDCRTAFAKSIFHMHHPKSNIKTYSEKEFMNVEDDSLLLILNTILNEDKKLKSEYDKEKSGNEYERFYNANKSILKSTIDSISKAFKNTTSIIKFQNAELLSSINNSISQIALPPDYFKDIRSSINNLPTYDFSKLQSAISNIPKIEFPELTSFISNIPKPIFDAKSLTLPSQEFIDSLKHINTNMAETLHSTIEQVHNAVNALASSIDFSLLVFRKEWSEQRDTLLKYGWVYSEEIPNDIIDYIYDNQSNLSIKDVDELIINYFRENRCMALKNIVSRWDNLSFFHCRKRIFHEALVNHSRRYYNSSVTILTVHTEGIITDFVRTNLTNPRFNVNKAIEDIKNELVKNENMSIYEYEVFNDVIEEIEAAFTESFEHSDPDAASNKSRHKIAHGHAYEKESEANSLKRFLYINEIYYLFLLLNDKEQI